MFIVYVGGKTTLAAEDEDSGEEKKSVTSNVNFSSFLLEFADFGGTR